MSNIMLSWPPITSVMAGALPLVRHVRQLVPVTTASSSPLRWLDAPTRPSIEQFCSGWPCKGHQLLQVLERQVLVDDQCVGVAQQWRDGCEVAAPGPSVMALLHVRADGQRGAGRKVQQVAVSRCFGHRIGRQHTGCAGAVSTSTLRPNSRASTGAKLRCASVHRPALGVTYQQAQWCFGLSHQRWCGAGGSSPGRLKRRRLM